MAFSLFYAPAFAVVAVWLVARLVLLNPVMVMERRGVGLFARSFRLTRGITWKVIGVLILYFIVSQVSGLATKLVFGAVFGLIAGGNGPGSVSMVLTSVLVAAVSTAFAVLAAAFTAKLYLAIRDAREAIVESA